jgi:two-component system response regulator FlrC
LDTTGVLLVDDDESLIRFAEKFLTRLGYPVASCRTAAEAHAVAAGKQLAVIDFSIAGQTGFQLAESLLNAHPALKVILWSGLGCDVAWLNQQYPGRVEFLMKPFAPKMFQDTVERLIGPAE